MLTNLKLFDDHDNRTQIINQFYNGLNQENIHDAVIALEERKHQDFPHGSVYFKNDLSKAKQDELNLNESDGLFIIEENGTQKGSIIPLHDIVQYLATNRERIAQEKSLSLIQLENIIDRLELTLKSEDL
ncbi:MULTISPECIES: hypothetical protein [Mammaliicoccus]|uniref:CBS domain-containing protein n=2 Tax=Staphylococcaceae TaxID=90964 RepID=A0AB37HSW5_MAMSC|nr:MULTISPECIES: hypothetical protein [Mammaliicoccus]MCD8796357.1 hypothetical protein [Mammaliicoccus sciuri]MCD8797742.1 hypothetical protein [Mammaliicoccus sciuri]MCD8817271.1 hypothetical protein [Mammaliicoccus sciuri]MCD8874125.1 hypothetical protein [Mammaliicoccus sciuri]MCE4980104.1 hypothetical protein [Mammaliicoccus sciuri]